MTAEHPPVPFQIEQLAAICAISAMVLLFTVETDLRVFDAGRIVAVRGKTAGLPALVWHLQEVCENFLSLTFLKIAKVEVCVV